MIEKNMHQHVTDEERREFLKALGVAGAVGVGGATLGDVREQLAMGSSSAFEPIGRRIRSDLVGELDAALLASQQTAFAEATRALPAVMEDGLARSHRDDFQRVADAGTPVYDHLIAGGFFESATTHLPEFTPAYLEESVRAFVGSEALAAPLADIGLSGEDGVDLVATVVANAERIDTYHWVATDEIPRERIEIGEHIPSMTQATAGGVLLWLGDLDRHLWTHATLLTDEILADAVWHGRSMAAGFHLLIEGALALAARQSESEATYSDSEIGTLLSTGFAVQAIAQGLLPHDVYWITEEMRAPRTGVKPTAASTTRRGSR